MTQTSILDFTDQPNNDWQTVGSSKKRKYADSPPKTQNDVRNSKNGSTPTKNRYQALASLGSEPKDTGIQSTSNGNVNPSNEESQKPARKSPLPPPIFLQDVTNFLLMVQEITKIIGQTFIAKTLARNAVKVTVSDSDKFRKLVRELNARKISFFTYQLKSEKAFRVVVRGLHSSIKPDDIKVAIVEQGFTVRSVSNIRHKKTKDPLPLFFVDLEPDENNKSIFDLRTLLHMRIQVESPRPKKDVVQCHRCQKYGHTRAYCSLPFACVKCGAEHETKDCLKSPDSPPNCALCGENHTANFKGCKIYQGLRTKPNIVPKNPHVTVERTATTHPEARRDLRSYSQVANNEAPVVNSTHDRNVPCNGSIVNENFDHLNAFFSQLMQHNSRIENLIMLQSKNIESMTAQMSKLFDILTLFLQKTLNGK